MIVNDQMTKFQTIDLESAPPSSCYQSSGDKYSMWKSTWLNMATCLMWNAKTLFNKLKIVDCVHSLYQLVLSDDDKYKSEPETMITK